jgi:hypothetical protein
VRREALISLAVLAGGWALTLFIHPWSSELVSDLYRYRTFAAPVVHGALPYRDAFFEYPPLAAPIVALPGLVSTTEEGFRLAFFGSTLMLGAGVVVLCGALAERTGGNRLRAMVGAALMPLLLGALVRTHFDLAPVVLVLTALLLLCAGYPRSGLGVLGLGVMTKAFPLVVAPVALAWLVARGERREAWQGGVVLVAVMLACALPAVAVSPGGTLDALRYQTERPVQIESTPALALLALDGAGVGHAVSVKSNASDGLEHEAAGLVSALFALTLVATIGVSAILAARGAGESGSPGSGAAPAAEASPEQKRELVLASLAAVAAFAVFGKVLSPQFMLWIVPLGALAFAWRLGALAAAVAAAAILTQLWFPARYFDLVARDTYPLTLLTLRNAALVAALALAVRALRPRRQEQLRDPRGATLAVRVD